MTRPDDDDENCIETRAILEYNELVLAHLKMRLSTINSARGVMVIVVGIGHGDTSSNPGRD